MNTIIQVYVPEKDLSFISWARKRFGRKLSSMMIASLRDMLEYEYEESQKSKDELNQFMANMGRNHSKANPNNEVSCDTHY